MRNTLQQKIDYSISLLRKAENEIWKDIPGIDGYTKETACCQIGWNNKLYVRAYLMPHQIKITNVRIEHLQDISDEDCLSDGVIKNVHQIPTKAPQFITDYYPCREMKEYSNKVGWGITYSNMKLLSLIGNRLTNRKELKNENGHLGGNKGTSSCK